MYQVLAELRLRVSLHFRRPLLQCSVSQFSEGVFLPSSVSGSLLYSPVSLHCRWIKCFTAATASQKWCSAAINSNQALELCSTAGHSLSSSALLCILRLCLLLVFTVGGRVSCRQWDLKDWRYFFFFDKGWILGDTISCQLLSLRWLFSSNTLAVQQA